MAGSGDGIKFSSKRPKGSKWGVSDAVTRAAETFQETGHVTLIPCMAFVAIDNVRLSPAEGDSDEPVMEITVKVAAIEALDTREARRKAHLLVLKETQKRLGSGQGQMVLPFEMKKMFDEVFGNVNTEEIEQDEEEARIDEALDDPGRLRRHLASVHGHDYDDVMRMEWADVRTLHDSDHDRPDTDGMPTHEREWWAWRRVDLAAAEAEADGTPDGASADADDTHEGGDPDQPADDDAADTDNAADDEDDDAPSNVTPLFADGKD